MEYQQLKSEIQRVSQVTEFNGTKLLSGEGDGPIDFQIGTHNDAFQDRISFDVTNTNASVDGLGIDEIGVSDKAGAQDALAVIDKATEMVSGQRANLGALQNRLTSTSRNLETSNENMSAANSRIRDVDYAQVTAKNATSNILAQAGTSVLAQANSSSQGALRLIG
jgi:flagellin